MVHQHFQLVPVMVLAIVESDDWAPQPSDFLHGTWLVLRRGKRNAARHLLRRARKHDGGGDLLPAILDAVVILGGLVTSTLLNLFIVPTLYLRFGRPATVEEARD